MIHLTLYTNHHKDDLTYLLDDKQSQYTALPSTWFDDNSSALKVVILDDDKVVGFFVLDTGCDKYDYSDDETAVLLRSMSINPIYQGQGFAKLALSKNLIVPFIKNHLPTINKIILGVHHKNTPAQQLYEKVGFVKLPKTYLGKKGEQWIYEMMI